ncbi:lipoxygenase family protein [Spartinivicinus ruber]|uniref:lipoxygenase family protein n=1 Tax=Spartinivicinus ruber TaxID=2683272 RepID=UPI0013D821C8|nr:lipoxygenase family protein [Spartinivicinus ruber]
MFYKILALPLAANIGFMVTMALLPYKLFFSKMAQYQWRDDFPNLNGVPLSKRVPYNDTPTFEWLTLLTPVIIDLAGNTIAILKSLNKPPSLYRDIEKELHKLTQLCGKADNALKDLQQGKEVNIFLNLDELSDTFTKGAGIKGLRRIITFIHNIGPEIQKEWVKSGNFEEYQTLFKTIKLPKVASLIESNKVFAELRVAGPNPMLIESISTLPSNFPLDKANLDSLFEQDDSLSKALQDQRIFICNYKELATLAKNTGSFMGREKYLYAPIAAFLLSRDRKTLKPIAIQCHQNSTQSPIITPKPDTTTDYRWQLAKTIVNYADGNYHELFVHLSRTHLVIEAFAVATHRTLNEGHPLFKLLVPHFEGTLFINSQAESSLIAPHGPIDQIFAGNISSTQQAAAENRLNFDFQAAMLHNQLKARNINDDKVLPYFPYRDDATQVWQTIQTWVQDYIDIYYESDESVIKDLELKDWYNEVTESGKIHNIPAITNKATLIEVLTMVIFTASAQHAAVNFPQRSLMTYAPVITGAVWEKIINDQVTKKDWLNAMPPLVLAFLQQAVLYTLGSVYYRPLGEYKQNHVPYKDWFKDPKVTNGPLPKFQNSLKQLEKEMLQTITTRNKKFNVDLSYGYLLPSRIPTSINI